VFDEKAVAAYRVGDRSALIQVKPDWTHGRLTEGLPTIGQDCHQYQWLLWR